MQKLVNDVLLDYFTSTKLLQIDCVLQLGSTDVCQRTAKGLLTFNKVTLANISRVYIFWLSEIQTFVN